MNYTRLLWGKDLQCTKFQVDSAPVIVVGVILLLVPVFFYSCMKIYGGRKEKEIIRRKSYIDFLSVKVLFFSYPSV